MTAKFLMKKSFSPTSFGDDVRDEDNHLEDTMNPDTGYNTPPDERKMFHDTKALQEFPQLRRPSNRIPSRGKN